MRLYQQLTGKMPSIMGDRHVGEYLEVVDRSHSTSGPVVEVVNRIQKTLEKIHFVEQRRDQGAPAYAARRMGSWIDLAGAGSGHCGTPW